MHFSNLGSMLLTAAMAITGAKASPSFSGLLVRDLSGSSCDDFVYGANSIKLGQVCVSVSGNNLIVKYPDLASPGVYTDLHAIVQTTQITEDTVGQWPYGIGPGPTKTGCIISGGSGTCTIPIQPSWRACNLDLYIGVHASFKPNGPTSTGGETGWRQGTCIREKPNCPKYFKFTTKCECPVVTKYAPYTTSLVYHKTIVETHTVTCSTTPPDTTATTTCNNPNPGATQVVSTSTSLADFACQTPAE